MKSIKTRMVVLFTAVVLILSLALTLVSTSIVRKDLMTDAYEDLMRMAQEEAKYINARVNAEIRYVSTLAKNPILIDETIPMEEKIAFCEAEAQKNNYLAFAFADRDGNSTIFNSKKETTNIAAREYFQKALKGEANVSDLLISSATGELVLIYAAPVYHNNHVIGVLYGRRDGSVLSQITNSAKYKDTGYAYMINNQGVTVAEKDLELVLSQENVIEDAKSDPSLQALADLTQNYMIKREVGYGEYYYNGKDLIAGFAPVEDTPWILAMEIEKQEILAEVYEMRNILLIICLIAIILGSAITFSVSTMIARPIQKITTVAKSIADGNFDVELSIKSKDEVGQLAQAFNLTIDRLVNYQEYIDEISAALGEVADGNLTVELQKDYQGQFKKLKENMVSLAEKLSNTMLQIQQASDQVAAGSNQVANASQALSQGATEQASSVEELSASIQEISGQIRSNAENAQGARQRADQAKGALDICNEYMKSMVAAMDQISVKSADISKIIKLIDEIAFQTNILALNAAVEAARAGAAGKGFAVVADEVRNLAAKSAAAASDTTLLIEESISAVDSGSGIARQTAQAMVECAEVTAQAVNLIDKIAQASNEQAASAAQISQGLDQISGVVQTNAATAEESAAASEELSSQSNLLKELIAMFKLRG